MSRFEKKTLSSCLRPSPLQTRHPQHFHHLAPQHLRSGQLLPRLARRRLFVHFFRKLVARFGQRLILGLDIFDVIALDRFIKVFARRFYLLPLAAIYFVTQIN